MKAFNVAGEYMHGCCHMTGYYNFKVGLKFKYYQFCIVLYKRLN